MSCYSNFEFYSGEDKKLEIQVNGQNRAISCKEPLAIDGQSVVATKVIQDLTFTSILFGNNGNLISVEYVGGGTAGAEVVTVVGNKITVQIEDGVSSAAQIKTKIEASADASALVSVAGVSVLAQAIQAETLLAGGLGDEVEVELPALPSNLIFRRGTIVPVVIENAPLGKISVSLNASHTSQLIDGSIVVRLKKAGKVIVAVAAGGMKKQTIPNC